MKDVIVITGGAGFCGTHLAEHFMKKFRVRLFDNFFRDSLKFAPHLSSSTDIELITGNILDREAVRAAIADAVAVIHCAAIAGVSNYYQRSVDTLRVNILGTFNLLDAMVALGVPRLIQFSTSEIYGPHAAAVTETTPLVSGPVSERRWVYAVSKLASEHAALRYGETYPIHTSIVRPFNIYGPRQTGEGAISNFARCLADGVPLEIHGDGSDVRAWCHVTDLVAAVDLLFNCQAAYGKAFNIGNPEASLTTLELARIMISLHGQGEVKMVPQVHSPIPLRTPDISRARSELGFTPKVTIEEGLRDTLRWFMREHR
jgi:nucleoside-diphosphate-sugar epimerase